MALVAALDAVEKLRVYNTLKAAEATGRNQRQEPSWGMRPVSLAPSFSGHFLQFLLVAQRGGGLRGPIGAAGKADRRADAVVETDEVVVGALRVVQEA